MSAAAVNPAEKPPSDVWVKRISTVRAELALKGYCLEQLADGSWLIARWGLASSPMQDISEVETFARDLGAPV